MLQVHLILKELVRKSIGETQVRFIEVMFLFLYYFLCKTYFDPLLEQELKRFPTLQAEIAAAANEALERFRDDGRKTSLRLVEMEASYLTADFFRNLPQEMEKGGNPAAATVDRYTDMHFRRIGSNVSSYIGMVSDTLKNTIPKAVVYCQVREAKLSLLNHFYTKVGNKEVLAPLLVDELCDYQLVLWPQVHDGPQHLVVQAISLHGLNSDNALRYLRLEDCSLQLFYVGCGSLLYFLSGVFFSLLI